MGNALKKVLLKTEEQPHEVLTAIREVCRQLDNVRLRFEMESDNDLIEAYIYEMEALRARYRYLLRLARTEGITAPGMPLSEEGDEQLMSLGLTIAVSAVGVVIALAVCIALFQTGKPVRGLVGSGAQGICALAAVNIAGAFTGVSLGLNLFSGLCCVVLGIPGVIGLLVLKLIFNL